MIATGIGYDVHRLVADRPLVLGGVEIPHPLGLDGHSDADVLCHAIADAVLGAAGEPDIGHLFPNTDPTIRGISSLEILRRVRSVLDEKSIRLHNIDATLIAEEPRIAPYLAEMKTASAPRWGLVRHESALRPPRMNRWDSSAEAKAWPRWPRPA